MKTWGKITGGMIGLFTGGPMGAICGIVLGHAADRGKLLKIAVDGLTKLTTNISPPDTTGAATAYIAMRLAAALGKKNQLLSLCLVTLAAKLAKCDGPVNRKEINVFRSLVKIPDENLSDVGRLFDLSHKRIDDFEHFAIELEKVFRREPEKLEHVLRILFAVARADIYEEADISSRELHILQTIHKCFGLDHAAWMRAKCCQITDSSLSIGQAYATLGLDQTVDDNTLRKRWRALVKQHHPDRLSALGVSPSILKQTEEKLATINVAWDLIRRERNF